MPPPRLALRPAVRQAAHAARLRPGRDVPGDDRGRHRARRSRVAAMAWWLCIAGTGERPYTEADRKRRPPRHRFPRRPRIERGDLLVIYAAGSAREYGEGRGVALGGGGRDEAEPTHHQRRGWQGRPRGPP